jgi:hypothetical protein
LVIHIRYRRYCDKNLFSKKYFLTDSNLKCYLQFLKKNGAIDIMKEVLCLFFLQIIYENISLPLNYLSIIEKQNNLKVICGKLSQPSECKQ